jgi:hypothetical protein
MKKQTWHNFKEAREFARSLGLKNYQECREYAQEYRSNFTYLL